MDQTEASQRLRVLVSRHVVPCVTSLFADHGLEVHPDPDRDPGSGEPTYTFAGIIGLVGELSGTLLVGADAALVGASHPQRQRKPRLTTPEQLDWVGELANQLTGRLKKRLVAHGLRFEFSPPISVTGQRLQHFPSEGLTCRAAFRAPGAELSIWIDLTMSDAAVVRPEFYSDDVSVEGAEGTVQLF